MNRSITVPWLVVVALSATGCSGSPDAVLCASPAVCDITPIEWTQIAALANPAEPPADPTNKYVGKPGAEALGQQFFWDDRFTGRPRGMDAVGRPATPVRPAKYTAGNAGNAGYNANSGRMGIACATCHNLTHAGVDTGSLLPNVSVGATWFDTNATTVFNLPYQKINHRNGDREVQWGDFMEGAAPNGSRLQTFWLIHDRYYDAYAAVFTAANPGDLEYALPSVADIGSTSFPATAVSYVINGQMVTLTYAPGVATNSKTPLDPATAGRCFVPEGMTCEQVGCRTATSVAGGGALGGVTSCWPRFPPEGRAGGIAGCQAGEKTTPAEPFDDAFDCMDPADQPIAFRAIINYGKAAAAFEAKLLSRDSEFDQYVTAGPGSGVISDAAIRGARLFVGKAACVGCHSGPMLSDGLFANLGVPQAGMGVPSEQECTQGSACDCVKPNNCLPWGALTGLAKDKVTAFKRSSRWSDDPSDTRSWWGDAVAEASDALKGAWRTPSLRDAALSAPYMHTGAYKSLAEVVAFYNAGGESAGYSGTKDSRLKPLGLTEGEQADLVAFLGTLNGAPLPESLTAMPTLP